MGETTCVSFSQIVLVYPLYMSQIAKILSVTYIISLAQVRDVLSFNIPSRQANQVPKYLNVISYLFYRCFRFYGRWSVSSVVGFVLHNWMKNPAKALSN